MLKFKALLALPFAFFLSTANADQLSDVLSEGKISIAVPENFPPFGSVGKSLEHEGYDVDVAKLIAEDLGVELEIVPVTSKQRIPFLSSGKVDLVISSMGANPERAKSIWFSSAYAPFFSGAFASADLSISSPADLDNLKVGLTGGTLEDLELSKLVSDDVDIVRFGDNAATISAYTSGQVDVLVTGNTVAASVSADKPELNMETKFIIKESPAFMGVKAGEKTWFGQELPSLPSL